MESQKPGTKSDEIDLAEVFFRIGNFINKGWMDFMRLLAKLRRIPVTYRWTFILIISASVGLGILFTFFIRNDFYQSKMIFSSDYLNKRLAENIIQKIDMLSRESKKKGLAKTLGLPDSIALNIIGFEITPFMTETDVVELEVLKEQLRAAKTATTEKAIEEVISRIEVENRHAYEITVQTLTPTVIPTLQDALIGYFQRNTYLQKRVEINRQNLVDLKAKLEKDIGKLDSLKIVIYESYRETATQSKGSNNVILGDKASDPVAVYQQGLTIYELYEKVNRDLFLQQDFELVDGFTEFSTPAGAGVVTMIFYSIIIGIAASYILVALLSFNRYLANLQ